MSTQEATVGQEPYVPNQEDIENAGKVESWRIANGKWRTGAGEDGTAQKDSVVGKPIRFGVTESYIAKDGLEVAPKFRVVLKLPDGGTFSGQMRLDSTQARYLMGALTLWDGVNFISITPNLSANPNKFGKHTTYANVKQCEGPGRWVELRWSAGDADWASLPLSLQEDLAKLYPSLYKNWVSDEEESEPWANLNVILKANGFEDFTNQPQYLDWIRKGLKNPTWDANNCTNWEPVEALVSAHAAKLPAGMKLPAGTVEEDPFADE